MQPIEGASGDKRALTSLTAIMKENFADRLIHAIEQKRSPCVVGLDTAIEAMPVDTLEALNVSADSPRKVIADCLLRFNKMVIDVVADLVPAVKPNAAFYERYGADGIVALEHTVAYAKEKGLIVILDAKRGDIGNTAQAYASAYLQSHKAHEDYYGQIADSLTVNPYLGEDTLEPFARQCEQTGTGIFVLVRTSNKGAAAFQDLEVEGGKVYERVADSVSRLGKNSIGKHGYSSIGAVVGATWPKDAEALRQRMSSTFFLVPGFGAQGGDIETVRACFDKNGRGAIVNSSRGVLYPQGVSAKNHREEIRAACEKFVGDVRTASGM
jgi:orotidine-5'-phosphate decarboxylase